MHIEQLGTEHLDAILEFETVNRAYFASFVPDRGDQFFANYPERHASLLEMQASGTDYFHAVLDDDGTVMGRVNLVSIENGEAELGYRIGRDFTGKGIATEAVARVCDLARHKYGLSRLRAATAVDNAASQAVLRRNGFTATGQTTLERSFALEL